MDAGNYFAPPGPQAKAANQLMLESLRRLPMDVLNLAAGDLYLWSEIGEKGLAEKFVSTNLVPKQATGPLPQPYAVVEAPSSGGVIRIGLLGLADPATVKPNSGFRAIDPAEAVGKTLPELSGKVDLVVLLADLSASASERLAKAYPQIDVVLRAEPRPLYSRPQVVNQAVILASVERGRSLGRLTLTLGEGGKVDSAEPESIPLEAGVPEDVYFLARQGELSSSN